ncbi:hypothetical protein BDR04DRAFT_1108203 [Suillus decipiens]|nr:hypothetical protein BDR04DRAFT_1109401 [Suillus decipiens]KAG2065662.1 hypothetical protein BDR04DRAFT_1108203 [Suillus decipiens]
MDAAFVQRPRKIASSGIRGSSTVALYLLRSQYLRPILSCPRVYTLDTEKTIAPSAPTHYNVDGSKFSIDYQNGCVKGQASINGQNFHGAWYCPNNGHIKNNLVSCARPVYRDLEPQSL